MAALNFPTSPLVDSTYTANGNTWKWDGVSWVSQASSSTAGVTTGVTTGKAIAMAIVFG